MSGHSKWSKLKHSKGTLDAKRGVMFTKLGNVITIAVREGGGDSDSNFKLRLAIESAKKANLPKDNIERAIKRGTGELTEGQIEEVIYEAFGPNKTSFVIEALTDNKNRTVANLRRIFNKHGGGLAGQNSVCWMFEKRGIIRIITDDLKKQEKIELKAIDLNAEDIKTEGDELAIYTKLEELEKIKKGLENQGVKIDYAQIEWFAKDLIKIDQKTQEKINAIFLELDDNTDINDYYTNIE